MSVYTEEELKHLEKLNQLDSAESDVSENNIVAPSTEESFDSSVEDGWKWLSKYNFPDEIIDRLKLFNISEQGLKELNVDLTNNFSVLSELVKLKESQDSAYKHYQDMSNDDFLREHALEQLLKGYGELKGLFKSLSIETSAYHKQLSGLDSLLNNHVEAKKEELESSISTLQNEVETIQAMALNTVAKAMMEQVVVFSETVSKENEERRKFFDDEYLKLQKGIDEAVKNANIKNILNKQTVIIFCMVIFTQVIICSGLVLFLR